MHDDYCPKTRKESKGGKNGKDKEGKGIYNQKAIRIQQELLEKRKEKNSGLTKNRRVHL